MTAVTLLTDFGVADAYVAAVKGVLLRLAPAALQVDLGHEVAPGDVEGGAWLLGAAWPWFPAGTIHLAVVDPGVGGDRRILAARAGGSWFVAPDNGLLTAVLARDDAEALAVTRDDLFLPGPGATFHGRDRFAPVAAWLARGEPWEDLGPVVGDAVRLAIPPPRAEGVPPRPDAAGAVLVGRVAHVDRFGNLITDLPTEWAGTGPCRLELAGHATGLRCRTYGEIPPGSPAVLPGSLGTLEVSLRDDSLARRWGVARGEAVVMRVGGVG